MASIVGSAMRGIMNNISAVNIEIDSSKSALQPFRMSIEKSYTIKWEESQAQLAGEIVLGYGGLHNRQWSICQGNLSYLHLFPGRKIGGVGGQLCFGLFGDSNWGKISGSAGIQGQNYTLPLIKDFSYKISLEESN